MFPWKTSSNTQESYICCGCLHVRHGTILIGVFHLVIQLLTLCTLGVVLVKNDRLEKHFPTVSSIVSTDDFNVSESTDKNTLSMLIYKHKNYIREDNFWGLMIVFFMICFTLMLVYGALKNRPGYLMPFFCVQVFQFCVTCLVAIGAFTYMPNIRGWLATQLPPHFPYHDAILRMNRDWLMLFVMVFFVLVLLIKVYFIGIVWSCYKYLHTRNRTRIFDVRELDSADSTHSAEAQANIVMPPKYEDAVRMTTDDQPTPPPYVP